MAWNPWKTNTHNEKLLASGTPVRARIVEFAETTARSGPGAELVVCKVTLEFDTAQGTVQVKGKLPIYRWELSTWSIGDAVQIRYDPTDPQRWTLSETVQDEGKAEETHAQGSPAPADPETIYGGVQVMNASGDPPSVVLEKLERVRAQGLITDAQLEAVRLQLQGGSSGASASRSAGVAERLRDLDALRAQSTITEEEYIAERRRILDSI